MAVPTSGALSLKEIAKERVNFTSSGGYGSSQIAPSTPYSLGDLSTSGNSRGNGFVVCPIVKVAPFPSGVPYGMGEFYGYINNRDGELSFQLGDNGPIYTVSTTISGTATDAATTYKINLDSLYPLTIVCEIASLSWAELSTSSGFYDGNGSAILNLSVPAAGASFYLKLAANTGSSRSVSLDVYGTTQCQRVDDAYVLNITQNAPSGGGGGGGLPPKGGQQ